MYLGRYSSSLNKTDFSNIPPNIQRIFYRTAINCGKHHQHTENKSRCIPCSTIIEIYDKILFDAGIFGRDELSRQVRITSAQKIPINIKGRLKTMHITNLLKEFKYTPESTYFYDDNIDIINEVKIIGVNAIHTPNKLQTRAIEELLAKKQQDDNSVNMILIDFNKTFSSVRYKKKYNTFSLNFVLERFLGGKTRINKLCKLFKQLEVTGVKIGFVTFHTKYVLERLLQKLGWYDI